jgi:hypothetical protein
MLSSRLGGIYSFDERTSLLLWTLPDVRSHSHIEFSNGYFVHDVGDGLTHVVYRRTRDMLAEGALEEDGVATTSSSTRRGHYSFYARLMSPSPIRAYRSVFRSARLARFNCADVQLSFPTASLATSFL